ncbi:hypothetical protein CHS0354_031353 [Potamilus streckersoni]|uniref:Uncharacterized protein n=1 Tax=Potamilus streckersoni TaxID=2493646 RepID=A0AAE0VWK4_9BIVA|nr:hypothetical protein CHS0354_031353 [Potamilus streckersoni]
MDRKKKGIFVVIIAILGFLFQLLAYVTPGWIVLQNVATINGRLDLGYSVWYAKYCSRNYCATVTPSQALSSVSNQVITRSDWIEIEAETTVAIIFSLLGIIITLYHRRKGEAYKVTVGTTIAIVSFFLSGIIPIIPIGKVSHMNEMLQDILQNNNYFQMQLTVPYCPIIAGIGAFFEFVAAISFSCCLHSAIHEARRTTIRERPTGVVISAISNDVARVQLPPSYQEVMEGFYNIAIVPPSYDEAVKYMETPTTKMVKQQTMEMSGTRIEEHYC